MARKQIQPLPDDYVPLSWDIVLEIASGKRRGRMPEDFNGSGFDPTDPTDARPGSEEKMRVMMERYKKRQKLFHPRDVR